MKHFRRSIHWYFLMLLALAAGFVWRTVFALEAERGSLTLSVFDIGQGDAIFIESPGGVQVLIDGGPDRSLLAKLGEALGPWDRSIDAIILTHPHADHLEGLIEVLRRYDVGVAIAPTVEYPSAAYREWQEEIRKKEVPLRAARRGLSLDLGGGASLVVLSPLADVGRVDPDDIHDAAVVLRLEHGASRALLMADAEVSVERQVIVAGGNLRAEVLKVGHHGSRTSTSQALLDAVSPQFAVISVGRKNRYGHPHKEVLERLAAAGARIFRTDVDGDIRFTSDGNRFSLSGERY